MQVYEPYNPEYDEDPCQGAVGVDDTQKYQHSRGLIDPVQQILSSLSVIFLPPLLSVSNLLRRLLVLVGLKILLVLEGLEVVLLVLLSQTVEVLEVEILIIDLPHHSRLNITRL